MSRRNPQLLYLASGSLIILGLLCAACIILMILVTLLASSDNQPTLASPPKIRRVPTIAPLAPPIALESTPPALPTTVIPPPTISPEQPLPAEEGASEAGATVEQNASEPPQEADQEKVIEPPAETEAVLPAPTLFSEARLVIANLDKISEVAELKNVGGSPQDLTGWRLFSELNGEECPLAGTLPAGETLQVWARVSDADQGGYNCGYPTDIWDDEAADAAILYNAAGEVVYQRR